MKYTLFNPEMQFWYSINIELFELNILSSYMQNSIHE